MMPGVTQPAASESRAVAKESVAHAPARSADAHFNFAMVVQHQDSATRGGRVSDDRSSWSKAAAIRRGQLKISAPLQWSGVASSNAMETRLHHVDGYVQDARSSTQQDASDGLVFNGDRPVTSVSTRPAAQDQQFEPKQQRPKTSTQDVKGDRRLPPYTTPRDSVMYDTSTSSESPKSTPSKNHTTGAKRRKSVALRSVIRRMFGKKERDDDKEPMSSSHRQNATTHSYQRSDATAMSENFLLKKEQQTYKEPRRAASQRVLSMPDADGTSRNPLGSHLPFPMNVNAPELVSPPPQQYLSFETSPKVHRRRATLPSIVLSTSDAAALQAMWAQSDEGRISPQKEDTHAVTPEAEIGIALGSGNNYQRRSRSAEELQHLIDERLTAEGRRRSAEIAYWRSSYAPQPGQSHPSYVPRPEDNAESLVSIPQDAHRSIVPGPEDVRDGVATGSGEHGASTRDLSMVVDDLVSEETQSFQPQRTPLVESANDIDVISHQETFLADPDMDVQDAVRPEMATDTATGETGKRISKLEESVQYLETSVRKLSGRNNRQTVIIGDIPKDRRSRYPGEPSSHSDGQWRHDVPYKQSSDTLSRPSMSSSWQAPVPDSPRVQQPGLSLSTSTCQADPNLPIPKRAASHGAINTACSPQPPADMSSSNIQEHLAPLYKALHHERNVRKTLESQIGHLQHQVYELSTIIHHLSSNAGLNTYPTPSPDQPMARASIETEKDFDARRRAELEEGAKSTTSRFSALDTPDHSDVEEDCESDSDTVSAGEVYRTPMESAAPAFSFDQRVKGDDVF